MEIWWIISFFKAGSVPFKEQALLSFCSENMLLVLYKIIIWLLENRVLLIYNKYKNWKFKLKNNNSYYLYRYFVIFLKIYFIIFYLINENIFLCEEYIKNSIEIFLAIKIKDELIYLFLIITFELGASVPIIAFNDKCAMLHWLRHDRWKLLACFEQGSELEDFWNINLDRDQSESL